MECVGTHYYRDVAYEGETPEQKAIEELQKKVEEINTTLAEQGGELDKINAEFVVVYPTDSDAVVQEKINKEGVSKVIFAKGVYNNITSTKTIPSYKTLIGYGAVINVPDLEWVLFMNATDGTVGGYNANTCINILGFEFNAENVDSTGGCSVVGFIHCNQITVKDCKFLHLYSGGHMIELNACRACVIDSNYFYDYTGTEMVQLDSASDSGAFPPAGGLWDGTACAAISITNNTFENLATWTASHGADTFPAAIGNHNLNANAGQISHIKIAGNSFAAITTAIRSVGISSSVIANNTMYGGFNFFSLGKDSASATTNKYVGNVIVGNSINCAAKSTEVTVANSYLHTAITYNGANSVISNNQIWNASADGIQLRGKDSVVAGNRISNCGRSGINLITTSNIIVSHNSCTANVEKSVEAFDGDFRATGTANCNISGNTVNVAKISTEAATTLFVDNIVTSALTNTSATAHGNMIAGVWIA